MLHCNFIGQAWLSIRAHALLDVFSKYIKYYLALRI